MKDTNKRDNSARQWDELTTSEKTEILEGALRKIARRIREFGEFKPESRTSECEKHWFRNCYQCSGLAEFDKLIAKQKKLWILLGVLTGDINPPVKPIPGVDVEQLDNGTSRIVPMPDNREIRSRNYKHIPQLESKAYEHTPQYGLRIEDEDTGKVDISVAGKELNVNPNSERYLEPLPTYKERDSHYANRVKRQHGIKINRPVTIVRNGRKLER